MIVTMPLLTRTQNHDLYDTNILSELTRPAPNKGVIEWVAKVSSIYLSVITVDEIYLPSRNAPRCDKRDHPNEFNPSVFIDCSTRSVGSSRRVYRCASYTKNNKIVVKNMNGA